MFSGIAACPLTATLLKRYARVAVPAYVQLSIALLIFIAGRVAVVLILHRPFMRFPTMAIAIAFAVLVIALMARRDHDSATRRPGEKRWSNWR
jgi:hypothetical protein